MKGLVVKQFVYHTSSLWRVIILMIFAPLVAIIPFNLVFGQAWIVGSGQHFVLTSIAAGLVTLFPGVSIAYGICYVLERHKWLTQLFVTEGQSNSIVEIFITKVPSIAIQWIRKQWNNEGEDKSFMIFSTVVLFMMIWGFALMVIFLYALLFFLGHQI